MSQKFHYLLKYVIVGDSAVGKSNILLRYIYNSFSEDFRTTIGVEFATKNIEINKKIYRVQLWDTAGQENFRSLARGYYKNSVCAIVVYDITNHESFENIQLWIDDCVKQTSKSVLLFLIGNKTDLNSKRQVSYGEGESFAKLHKMFFLETSAKEDNNINELFELSVKQIDKNIRENKYDLENDNCGIKVGLNKDAFVLGKEPNCKNKKKKSC